MLAKLNRPVRSPVNVPGPLGESYRFSPHPLPTVALGNVRRHYTLPALEWTTLVNRQTIEHLGLPLRETLRDGALRRPPARNMLPFQRAQNGCLLRLPIMVVRHIYKSPLYPSFSVESRLHPWFQRLV